MSGRYSPLNDGRAGFVANRARGRDKRGVEMHPATTSVCAGPGCSREGDRLDVWRSLLSWSLSTDLELRLRGCRVLMVACLVGSSSLRRRLLKDAPEAAQWFGWPRILSLTLQLCGRLL